MISPHHNSKRQCFQPSLHFIIIAYSMIGGGRKASASEMDKLRTSVQEAYKSLKAKRREDMMEKTFGTGKRMFIRTNDFA